MRIGPRLDSVDHTSPKSIIRVRPMTSGWIACRSGGASSESLIDMAVYEELAAGHPSN